MHTFNTSQPAVKVHHLTDYQPPQFNVEAVFLTFELSPQATRVTNRMRISRVEASDVPLILDGEDLTLVQVAVNGEVLSHDRYQLDEVSLQLPLSMEGTAPFDVEVITEINPAENTALEGLYLSSGNYCTQCEAESFRKITYYLDRPDVMSYFTTKIIAPKSEAKVLLSNGNLIETGELEGDRHFAVWEDPFKKPCYLFALVAGHLASIEDHFITLDGRKVALKLYVEAHNIDKCEHAMASLKKAMAWDERRFGLIYDLDIYMIVAVDDFNMGAMENKGLNVFNSKYVLAKPETATDTDYEGIEGVIGHEYFHNWTGNRVTCRDWFQLTLKEGLTVFRDQEFTADMLSPAVKRIEDVKRLRTYQFPEDAGPMAHPIQPQSYIEMNNFYTVTVYEKGAEVVRLYHTLLGEAGFRAGMDLYFERYDGQAVTVEDFRNAMADANDVDLSQMHHWYIQAGTPVVKVNSFYDANEKRLTLECSQWLHGKQQHQPFLIPLKIGVLSATGEIQVLDSHDSDVLLESATSALLQMTELNQIFVLEGVETAEQTRPIPVMLRHYSAPIILEYDYSLAELSTIAQNDEDAFMRWEAIQQLALNALKNHIADYQQGRDFALNDIYAEAFITLLNEGMEAVSGRVRADLALIALALKLPDLTYIGEQYEQVDIEAIYHTHCAMQVALAQRYQVQLMQLYQALNHNEPYVYDKKQIAQRMLKNVCLHYLGLLEQAHVELMMEQYQQQQNMTDVLAALEALSHTSLSQRDEALNDFYQRWHHDALVLDKWFALQAGSHHKEALAHVQALIHHPDFTYTNPNRVRSVLGVFGRSNLMGFHRADGKGYDFLKEQVLKLDEINPQIAARIVSPFTQWQRYDEDRQQRMRKALEEMLAQPNLSKDLYEVVSRSLG